MCALFELFPLFL